MLILRDNGLAGRIPDQISQLERLRVLDLSKNSLSGQIPPTLGNVFDLRSLVLAGNNLSGAIPPEVGQLKNLKYLNLSSNRLNGAIPPEIGELNRLHTLRVAGNRLTGEIPPELGTLSTIETLDLSSNSLQGPLPPEIGNLATVWELLLNGNRLSGPLPPQLAGLSELAVLNLRSNSLSGPLPAELGYLASIQDLDLSRNQLTGPIPLEWGRLPRLRRLRISENKFTGPIPAELGRVSTLEALYVANNGLTGEIPSELGRLSRLRELDVSGNRLAGIIHPALHRLRNLEVLRLGRTHRFNGCLPAHWKDVKSSDTSGVRLPTCPFGLAGLDVGPGHLEPTFAPEVREYKFWLRNDAKQFTIEPALAGTAAEFHYFQGGQLEDSDPNRSGFQFPIADAPISILIQVNSSDGSRQAVYELTVQRIFPGKLEVVDTEPFSAPNNEALKHNVPNLAVEIDGQPHLAGFLIHFHETGAAERWGYPTSEVLLLEPNTLTQFYQRGAVDFHNVGAGWVTERRLAWDYVGGDRGSSTDQGVESDVTNPYPGTHSGPWGHKVSGQAIDGTPVGFADFYQRLGRVASFGFPKTDARADTNEEGTLHVVGYAPGIIRQYFQGAVFEYHPGNPDAPVQLSLLGDTVRNLLVPGFEQEIGFSASEPLTKGNRYVLPVVPMPTAIQSVVQPPGEIFAEGIREHVAQNSRLRFYESDNHQINRAKRLYSNTFNDLTARSIWWDFEWAMPAQDEELEFEFEIRYFDPAGVPIYRVQTNFSRNAPSRRQGISARYGLDAPGYWKPGIYLAELALGGRTVASEEFMIEATRFPVNQEFSDLRRSVIWGPAPNSRSETVGLLALAELHSTVPHIAVTIASWDWVRSEVSDSNVWFLQFLAAWLPFDRDVVGELVATPWIADGLTSQELSFLQGTNVLERQLAISAYRYVSGEDQLPNWRVAATQRLRKIASQLPSLLPRLLSQPWLLDGFDPSDAARIAVVSRTLNKEPFVSDLLQGPRPFARSIDTELTDSIDLAVVWRHPTLTGFNPIDWLELGVRYIEEHLGRPWPASEVLLVLEPRMELLSSGNGAAGYYTGDYVAVGSTWGELAFRQILFHELGHFYFRGDTVPAWLSESAPTYLDLFGRTLTGELPVDEMYETARRDYETACISMGVKTVQDLLVAIDASGDSGIFGTDLGRCYYVLGHNFLLRIQQLLGAEAVGSALGYILLIKEATDTPATDQEVLEVFRRIAPPDKIATLDSLLADLYGERLVE